MTTKSTAKTNSDANLLEQLKKLGFSDDYIESPRRLIASISGREKTGKTHFSLTGEGPIVYLNVDIGTEGVMGKFQEQGKTILTYDVRVPREGSKDQWSQMWSDFKVRVRKVYELRKGTVVWDSVAAESPLVLKNKDGHIWIGSIEDFWLMHDKSKVQLTLKGEEVLHIEEEGWRVCNTVWNFDEKKRVNPWTAVKTIIRHPYKGNLLRFTTSGGTIRVTANHSLMSGLGSAAGFVAAAKLQKGDRLSLPMYVNTPSNKARKENGCLPFVGPLDLAWLFGFFVAEGSAWSVQDKRFPGWSGFRMAVVNQDESLIDKSKRILEENFHVAVSKSFESSDGIWKASVSNSGVAALFNRMFYNAQREKIVPMEILNAVDIVKKSFWNGYMDGDGHFGNSDTPEFTTTSPSLASALIWMKSAAVWGDRDVSVYTRQDKPSVVKVTFPLVAQKDKGEIRSIVSEEYDGMIYDLETENHAFCAGVGGILCHNTATEVYELARLAHFGKLTEVKPSDYAVVNNEWREVLRLAYDSHANTMFIHKVKAVWKMVANSRGGSSLARTDEFELSGFSEMEYLVQANLVSDCTYDEDGPHFTMFIKNCRQNPNIAGTLLEGPMCNLPFLINLVHGAE